MMTIPRPNTQITIKITRNSGNRFSFGEKWARVRPKLGGDQRLDRIHFDVRRAIPTLSTRRLYLENSTTDPQRPSCLFVRIQPKVERKKNKRPITYILSTRPTVYLWRLHYRPSVYEEIVFIQRHDTPRTIYHVVYRRVTCITRTRCFRLPRIFRSVFFTLLNRNQIRFREKFINS